MADIYSLLQKRVYDKEDGGYSHLPEDVVNLIDSYDPTKPPAAPRSDAQAPSQNTTKA